MSTIEWRPVETLTLEEKHSRSWLLHGPGLVDLDFNPEGVERGYWQDAPDGSEQSPGFWICPGWDGSNDEFYTRELKPGEVTHATPIPRGEHSDPLTPR